MYQMQNQNMAFNPNPSYAAYQYNPMQRFQQPEPQIPQMQPQFLGIQGKVVQSESAIMANDVPMDGSVAFFPMQDMSAIVAKQWDANGTIRKTVYKPFNEQMADSSSDDKRIEIGLSLTNWIACLERWKSWKISYLRKRKENLQEHKRRVSLNESYADVTGNEKPTAVFTTNDGE